MAHYTIPPNAVSPGDSPTDSPWVYEGTAGSAGSRYADCWSTDTPFADLWSTAPDGSRSALLRVMLREGHALTDAGLAAAGAVDFPPDAGRRSFDCKVAAADLAETVSRLIAALQTPGNVS
jgi:hypothetical protein